MKYISMNYLLLDKDKPYEDSLFDASFEALCTDDGKFSPFYGILVQWSNHKLT